MPKNREILRRPLVSEKSMEQQESGIYTFVVDRLANKFEIAKAVEVMFNVKVDRVRTTKIYPKPKRTRTGNTHTSTQKKAEVQLQEGYVIETLKVQ
ncbi:MAG: 50S ribosomal protein L23 [Caldisericia bacterium]|nr:50S ribosomal protein L23 [Caldisericia bacterium]